MVQVYARVVQDPAVFTVPPEFFDMVSRVDPASVWLRCGLVFWQYVSDHVKECKTLGPYLVADAVKKTHLESWLVQVMGPITR